MFQRHRAARNIEVRNLLDTFLVCAITTILLIRLQLWATNYPKLGGGKLHIAHLLWGGLGMAVAILLLLTFLGGPRRHLAAILGGVGFAFFIDELGKFVTSDNDYFFKPAAGIIYIVFILLFLAIRELGWRHRWSPQECLANAMELLSQTTYRQLHERERKLARDLLARCDRSHAVVPALSGLLERIEQTPSPPPGRLVRAQHRARDMYYRLAEDPRFEWMVSGVFIAVAVVTLVEVGLDARRIFQGREHVHVILIGGMTASLVASGLIWVGASRLRSSRIEAFRWFERALLVQVFLTEVFSFLQSQFAAVFSLLLYVGLLLMLRTMVDAERHRALVGHASQTAVVEAPGTTKAAGALSPPLQG